MDVPDADLISTVACNGDKFSYHLVARTLGTVFESSASCNLFTKLLLKLASESDDGIHSLMIRKAAPDDNGDPPKPVPMVDLSIYSELNNPGKNMRTMYSVKRDEQEYRPLRLHIPKTSSTPASTLGASKEE